MSPVRDIFGILTRNWQRTHAVLAPFGTGISTLILSVYAGDGKWTFWYSWDELAAMASIGVITYGMTIISSEGGASLVFWALDERDKRRERRKKQQTVEILDHVEEALRQDPGSDPFIVIEQMRDRIRNGQTG